VRWAAGLAVGVGPSTRDPRVVPARCRVTRTRLARSAADWIRSAPFSAPRETVPLNYEEESMVHQIICLFTYTYYVGLSTQILHLAVLIINAIRLNDDAENQSALIITQTRIQ
jgi:hypothetical protein